MLHSHLFPGDGDEHGAVVAVGVSETERGGRLLAREVFPARDGLEYVPGSRGYRALTAQFVAEKSGYCADENLGYLAVHCHGGDSQVEFSEDDWASHERGYPALLDITKGGPVGALVFARDAVAGDIWTASGRHPLDYATVVGRHVRRLYPAPQQQLRAIHPSFHRQARLFGDIGQDILRGLKIGIIGLGGGGSLLNEWLARLGIGHIVAVDFDRIDLTNLPRVVGATLWDARAFLTARKSEFWRGIGKSIAARKVDIARRVAKRANPAIRFDAVVGSVLDENASRLLRDVDFLFLASDTIQSRLVFNALVHQYLIPGAQVGAKVSVDPKTMEIADILAVTRLVLPHAGCGCLECHGVIPPARLQEEALSETERRRQRYVDDPEVVEPSVITLNVLSAGQAANDLMMMFTGLFEESAPLGHVFNFVRERKVEPVGPQAKPHCLDCSMESRSRRARGDRARLPCRMSKRWGGTHTVPKVVVKPPADWKRPYDALA
jgi:tRNA A37 threonylcarbamoyladenosine dehydratase